MDNTKALLGIVESVLGKGKRTSGNNYAFHCPVCFHHKPKLEVNLEVNKEGVNNWACWVCGSTQGTKGKTLVTLFKKAGASKQKILELKPFLKYIPNLDQKEDSAKLSIELPPEYKPLLNATGTSITLKQALAYLKQRRITQEDIIKYGIGYCERGRYANSIILQSFDSTGKLNYYISRSFEKDPTQKYKAPRCDKHQIIGMEYFVNWKCPIILCEGIFDAIAIRRNAIPLFGKTISNALMTRLVQNDVKTLYIALDNDALKDALKHAQQLLNLGKEVYLVELKGKDPSDIGFEEMTKLLQRASPLSYATLLQKKLEMYD